ncbi:MAG TPA: glycosyltransferase family 4 protein [Actinospica sp.]|jgi:glycosyltransferase involved in cell wall biosynthesis|nr:glycosyltransferase family 4 protein [Actinospica sp.]
MATRGGAGRSAGGGLRVALVLGASVGGIGSHVRDLAAHCVARGDRVVVAGPAQTGVHFGFTDTGARFVPLPARSASAARMPQTRRTLRRVLTEADVVHSHGVKAAALTNLTLATLPAGSRPRHVVTLHNALLADGLRGLMAGFVERLAVRRADLVLGASADLVQRALEAGAKHAVPCRVPAPPRPSAEYAEPADRDAVRATIRATLHAEVGLDAADDDVRLVLAVGRLTSQKSYPLLLDAVDILGSAQPFPAMRVLIAGEGPERAALAAGIARRELPVTLLGHRGDVADLLNAADAFVLCSRWEARALVVQEALRAGTPVVATAVGGIPELVGDAALLVPWSDPHALAAALHRVLTDKALEDELRQAGPAQAATWPTAAEALDATRAWYAAD